MYRQFTILAGLVALVSFAQSCSEQIETSLLADQDHTVVVTGQQIEHLIETDFIAFDADYLDRKAGYMKRLHEMAMELADMQATGKGMACSNQIFLEVKWLIHYTADWPRVDRRLAQLAESLKNTDQEFALKQSSQSGTWGACYEEWFLKTEATLVALEDLYDKGLVPQYPVTDAEPISTPQKLEAYLRSLLISTIRQTGRDNRAELGVISTLLSSAFFKGYLAAYIKESVHGLPHVLGRYSWTSFAAVYERFLLDWQDPATGYWGAWYHSNGQVYKTTDLGITYHTIAYRRGDVPYWRQIIQTTFRTREDPYPYGWLHDGHPNNHNNYDVARILRYAWPHMTGLEKERVEKEISSMLAWTLSESLTPEGTFKTDPTFFSSLSAEYYFGVSFLDEIGYWDPDRRYWTNADFPNAIGLCCLIKARLVELQLDQAEARYAFEKLTRNCWRC